MAQRLLLADDSVTIQKVIELTFADEHIEVVAVSDGAAAVARLNAEPFDIVLADAGMPGVGASAVRAKRFEPQVLVSKVRELLKSAPVPASAPPPALAEEGAPAADV